MRKAILVLSFVSGFSVGASYRERAVCEASNVETNVPGAAARTLEIRHLLARAVELRSQAKRGNQKDGVDVLSRFTGCNLGKRHASEVRRLGYRFRNDWTRNIERCDECDGRDLDKTSEGRFSFVKEIRSKKLLNTVPAGRDDWNLIDGNTCSANHCSTISRAVQFKVEAAKFDDGSQQHSEGPLTAFSPALYKDVDALWTGRHAGVCDGEGKTDENTHLINHKKNMDEGGEPGEKSERYADRNERSSDGGAFASNRGICGDGQVDSDEECDDGNHDTSDRCVRCKRAKCGDGYLSREREECERGSELMAPKCKELLPELVVYNPDARIGCTSKCEVDFGTCRFCGDRILQADFGELCDGTVGCVQLALDHDVYPDPAKEAACGEQCKTVEWKECPRCGDSVVDFRWGEECDDGNEDSSDGCDRCVLTGDDEIGASPFTSY